MTKTCKNLYLAIATLMLCAVPHEKAHAQLVGPLPCTALYCLNGLMLGSSGGPECVPDVSNYFAIQVWDHHGFDCLATYNLRLQYLTACQPAMPGEAPAVNAVYGCMLTPPGF